MATESVISDAGGLDALLARVARVHGVRFPSAHTFGTVRVTATQVAHAYRALLLDEGPRAEAVRACMRKVPPVQQLGTRSVWAIRRGVDVTSVGVKCGWDLTPDDMLLTHAVVMDESAGVVVLTRQGVPGEFAARWRQALLDSGPSGHVLTMHTITAGSALFAALRQTDQELLT